jgi:cytoskeleton protein RodZ
MNEQQPVGPLGEGGQPSAPHQDHVAPSSGAQLAAYRQERGWTIEQVASQLNLAPRQVLAIEIDDFKALPGMAVARGFVRAYAKLLKIDPAPFLANMALEPGLAPVPGVRRTVAATPYSEPRFPDGTYRRGLPMKYIGIAAAVILVAAGLWAAKQNGYLSSVTDRVEGELAHLGSGGASKPASSNSDVVTSPLNPPLNQSTTPGTVAADPTMQAPVMPPASEAAATAGAAAATATGKDALVLTARQDSWIQVKGPGNRTVVSRMLKAGETQTVEIKEPVSVVIGNALGVEVTLRGEPLAIKGSGKTNVARLNLK